jgi:monoamine oxidase
MAKSSLSRRKFLKYSALGSSALALGGCASLDRYFMGDLRDLNGEVVISSGFLRSLIFMSKDTGK